MPLPTGSRSTWLAKAYRNQAASKRDAFANQVDREPVGNEEPDGVGKALGDNDSPSLRKLQEIAPSRQGLSNGFGLRAAGEDHLALGFAEARMVLRQEIHFAPDHKPQ